ncbi:hypothetical protein SAMN05444161_2734 [Rhizobiales bacterium GAS191]|nr:hypothetical protein SAMN05444161_2734 [Rhizobiales bacterium GAS191]
MTGGKLKYWNTGRATLISFFVFGIMGAIQGGIEQSWNTSVYSIAFISSRGVVIGLISAIIATIICISRNRSIAKASTPMPASTGLAVPNRIEPRFGGSSLAPDIGISPAIARERQAQSAKPRRFNNFIARHWRGELPLWLSYWVIGFLGNIVIGIILMIAHAAAVSRDYDPRLILGHLVVIWLGIGAMAPWQFVGVWRSAEARIRERARMGRNAPWAALAKLAVVLGVLRLGAALATTGIPQITEASRMVFLDDPDLPPYALRIMRNGTELEVMGGFKYGLHDDLIRLLRAAPKVRAIHLDSIGGRVGEAEKVYKTIRDRGFVTYVAHECMSACTVAFAGGRERWMGRQAKLGFHAPDFAGMRAADLADMTQGQREIFAASGFDKAFVDRAFSTPNNKMWTPSVEELSRARVVTHVSNGSDFAISGYGATVTREKIATQFQAKQPILATLRNVSPKDFDAIIDGFFSGYQDGRTESELIAAARQRLLAAVRAFIPLADDAVLIELGRLLVDEYTSLAGKDPSLCYQYASGAADIDPRNFPAALIQRETALHGRVLKTASQRPALPRQDLEALFAKVGAELAKRIGTEKLRLLTGSDVSPAQYADYCAGSIAFYQEIIRLNEADAAALMREIFGGK